MRLLFFLLLSTTLPALAAERVIHVFVALCDNASQGIQPVPAKIGNGDDPANNLYWGCDGVPAVFAKSKAWKRMAAADPDGEGPVLERVVYFHSGSGAWLVADGYRGREIKTCLTDYLAAMAGTLKCEALAGEKKIAAGGAADLIVYAGHNGLMEFQLPTPEPAAANRPKAAVALCCLSRSYFPGHMQALKATPLVLTSQLMYPAGTVIHAVVNGWLAGKDGAACVDIAGAAYAANQKISKKAATGVFCTGFPEK